MVYKGTLLKEQVVHLRRTMTQASALTVLLALAVLASGEYLDPHCDGKQVIVHLFEWKWTEIAKECERFLGPWGYCGVQVSPPNEHVVITTPPAPWWQRYQPVSYKLVSRGGNEAEFADMVKRCNAAGVRIFVDAIINHMAGTENSGHGSGGTQFDGPTLSFPGVPYSAPNFNPRSKCPSGDGHVNNYGDPNNVRNCYLLSLADLDQSQDHVRQMIVGYYNHLIDLGVAGFRVDASKHMWPADLAAIQGATKDTQFGGKPFYMHEVIDQNDGAVRVNEYYDLGRVTEFRYCQKIKEGVGNFGSLRGVVDYGWGMADNDHALVFVDNHDNQRGHGGGGQIITHKQPHDYRLATAFTLAWNYGFTRVMSSYSFGDNSDQGPPHNADYSTAEVPINSDGSCGGGWVCEHRWPSVRGMPLFRNAVAGTDIRNYFNQNDVVAFSRGNKGFFAMGKRGFDQTFQTGLPAGQYCDLISNCRQKVTVDDSGNAHVTPASSEDPVVAIIVGGPTAPILEGATGTAGVGGGTGPVTELPTTDQPQAGTSGPHTTPASATAPGSRCEDEWGSALPGSQDRELCSQPVVTAGNYTDPHCDGKQVIVHLFEWKWTDIAKECERFLGPRGFCGVQVSPAMEHPTVTTPPHPWWQRYQPVSYKLVSRSGDEQQFADMVSRCNAAGVRVYVDVQLNHMTGTERSGTGTAGSHFDGGTLVFPGVPYTAADFNSRAKCPSGDGHIHDYGNAEEVRNCQLLTLADLDQSQAGVRQKQAAFLNHLLDLGVAGFRVDAAKHMWPRDLAAIQGSLKDTLFGGRPFFLHEVIDLGDGAIRATEYTDLGYVTEFKYGGSIAHGIQDFGFLKQIAASGMLDSGHALVFVDNHDNQRGHGAGGNMLTFNSPHDYMLGQAFTLAWNYGVPRLMSSYHFSNPDEGPPHDASFATADVTIEADGTCSGGWVCEHRWPAIANMVAFRNHVTGTDVGHFVQHGDVVGFARGAKAYFAMGKRGFDQTFQTGLPAGQYCDLISNCRQKVTVDDTGSARLAPFSDNVPIVAFLVDGPTTGCDAGGGGGHGGAGHEHGGGATNGDTSGPQTTVDYGSAPWRRTVILIEKRTSPGQDLFIRGGIGHEHRPGCTTVAATSACAIPIRHRAVGTGDHYAKVNAWSKGDNYLDWYGAETGQGTFGGRPADGTPAVWTTNDLSHPGHSQFNTFGQHYWLVDIDMDCSRTDNGYFELKAIVGGWEGNVVQGSCTGSRGGAAAYSSSNHIARCGFLNIYHFGTSICTIEPIP